MGESEITAFFTDSDHAPPPASSTSASPLLPSILVRRRFLADSTLSEVLSWALSAIPPQKKIFVVDVTCHPNRVILGGADGDQVSTGLTLQSLGWYPSGRIVILQGGEGDGTTILERLARVSAWAVDLNDSVPWADSVPPPATSAAGSSQPALRRPVPSEVISSIAARFDGDDLDGGGREPSSIARRARRRKEEELKEEDRQKKLDAAVRKQVGGVGSQVRRMLIQGGASGDFERIAPADRFHLEITLDGGEGSAAGPRPKYLFLSRMAPAGRVALAYFGVAGAPEGFFTEALVRAAGPGAPLRRLPDAMMLYELEAVGLLEQFSVVIIRVYGVEEAPTTLAVPTDGNVKAKCADSDACGAASSCPLPSGCKPPPDEIHGFRDCQIDKIFTDIEAKAAAKKEKGGRRGGATSKKKVSPQLRRMMMKSRSVGDSRIIPTDRFYLEVLVIGANNSPPSAVGMFFSRSRTIAGVALAAAGAAGASASSGVSAPWEVLAVRPLVGSDCGDVFTYIPVDPVARLSEVEAAGLLGGCDRIVVRRKVES